MKIFALRSRLPREERYALVDQILRSSRWVCANLAEAWQKRRYKAAFVAKLSDSSGEAAETIVWLEFAERCMYLDAAIAERLRNGYSIVVAQLVQMS